MRALAIFVLTISIIPASLAALNVENTEIAGTTPSGVPYVAEWEQARTTGYYTPSCEQFKDENGGVQWCHEENDCITTIQELREEYPNKQDRIDDAAYCVIPEDERGFYESVLCQGSAICNGKLYHYSTIQPQKHTGALGENYENGKTSQGDDPQPQHTIAVNPNPESDCYLPPETKVYIDLGDTEWSGTYVAEDTGSAFRGDGRAKNGNCKIDIYTGVGKDSLDRTKAVSNQNADVYIIEWGSEQTPVPTTTAGSDTETTSHATGNTRAKYTNTVQFKPPAELFKKAQETVKNLQDCQKRPYEEKSNCLKSSLNDVSTQKYQAATTCNPNQTKQGLIQQEDNNLQIIAQGTIESLQSITDSDGKSERTLQISQGSTRISLSLTSSSAEKLTGFAVGDTVKIYDRTQPQTIQGETQTTIIQPINLDLFGRVVEETSKPQRTLNEFLLRSADCTTADKTCVCEQSLPSRQITFNGQSASLGTSMVGATKPYNFIIGNGSQVTTELKQDFIEDTQIFKQKIESEATTATTKQEFTSPTTEKAYLLHHDSKLAFLYEKPEWYNQSNNVLNRYQDLIKTMQAPQAQLLQNLQQNETPTIQACKPRTYHQTICIKHNATQDNSVEGIRNQALNLPPLKFTVKI